MLKGNYDINMNDEAWSNARKHYLKSVGIYIKIAKISLLLCLILLIVITFITSK